MSVDNYQKYTYRVSWSQEDQSHIGTCLELPGLSVCEASPEETLREIKLVAHEALIWLQEQGKPIPEPLGIRTYSGKLTLRIPTELHREIVMRASEEGVSINQYILSKIH